MPLYRQVGIFGRDGVDLDRSTLCDWAGITAWWLKPVWELMVSTVLSTSPKLFCDDTYLPVMAKGKTHKGALFGYARDDSPWDGPLSPAVVYVYTDGRKHQGNRVNDSCGDKAGEEVVIPGSDLAAETH